MSRLLCRWTLVLFATVGVLALSEAAQAGPVNVAGGGTAAFTDPRFGGLTTQFGIGVAIHPGGKATGDFACVIKGVLAFQMIVTGGTVNGDGTVSLTGIGMVYFAGGGMLIFPSTLDVKAGGPGVGEFCLGPPTYDDTLCDHEVVVTGKIVIN